MSNSKDVRMIALRKQMKELGVDINNRKNGIWLPNTESARSPAHLQRHTRAPAYMVMPTNNTCMVRWQARQPRKSS
ncbi:AHH domain-containing protein [Pseudomonas sp. TWI628]|uniref:AHH domain-containing protein n=1 Tax=Pseudomonas sp. TWI628 TaxID=3136788 RepID=UPI003208A890